MADETAWNKMKDSNCLIFSKFESCTLRLASNLFYSNGGRTLYVLMHAAPWNLTLRQTTSGFVR